MLDQTSRGYHPMDESDDTWTALSVFEGWDSALMGAVFDASGQPVPCYCSQQLMTLYLDEGFSESEAMRMIETEAEGHRLVFVHPLEADQVRSEAQE